MKAKYVKLIGTRDYFQRCWGIGWVDTKVPITIIALIPYFDKKYLDVAIDKHYSLTACPNITNDVFSLKPQGLKLKEWKPADENEIKQINAYMRYYKFSWREEDIPNYHKEIEKREGLYWACDKDDYVVIFNGQRISYKSLKEYAEHGEIDYVELWGDNGYSHCWSDSKQFNSVIDLIEQIFKTDFTDEEIKIRSCNHNPFGYKRVLWGEHRGWHFDYYGRLIVNTYNGEKKKPYSEVSNS